MKRKIALIGMMGSGKTTVGKCLAQKTNMLFYDSDDLIKQQHNKSIEYIFQHHGEEYFRILEKSIIFNIVAKITGPVILSLGGGSFIQEDIRKKLQEENFCVIWLKVSPKLLFTRLKKDYDRPLLISKNIKQELLYITKAREPIYSQADLLLNGNSNPKHLANKIINLINKTYC